MDLLVEEAVILSQASSPSDRKGDDVQFNVAGDEECLRRVAKCAC